MSSALYLSPVDGNYLASNIRYNQYKVNYQAITVNETNFTSSKAPVAHTYGDGTCVLRGTATVAGTPTAYYELGSLPGNFIPASPEDQYFPVVVLRAGVYVQNALQINRGGDSVLSVNVTDAGSYATMPTVSVSGVGSGCVLVPSMKAVSATYSATGSGYAPADTITITGGTGTASVLTVSTTRLVSVAVNAGGSGYVVSDTITLDGGTATTPAVLTVATVDGGGAVLTFTVTTAGSYTANTASFTQASTSGAGTGATFNTALFGVDSVTVSSTAGSYTALPANPVSQGSSSGSGTGAEFTVLWGLLSVAVSSPGRGYDQNSYLSVTGGGGSGGADGSIVLDEANGTLSLINTPTVGDVVVLDGVSFFMESYN